MTALSIFLFYFSGVVVTFFIIGIYNYIAVKYMTNVIENKPTNIDSIHYSLKIASAKLKSYVENFEYDDSIELKIKEKCINSKNISNGWIITSYLFVIAGLSFCILIIIVCFCVLIYELFNLVSRIRITPIKVVTSIINLFKKH